MSQQESNLQRQSIKIDKNHKYEHYLSLYQDSINLNHIFSNIGMTTKLRNPVKV